MSGLWLDGAPTTGLQAFKGQSIVTARSQHSSWSSQSWNLLVRHVFFSQEQITLQAKMFQVHQAIRHTMPVCFSGTPGQPVAPLPQLLSTSLRAWKQPCSLVAGRVLHSCCIVVAALFSGSEDQRLFSGLAVSLLIVWEPWTHCVTENATYNSYWCSTRKRDT